MEWCHPYSEWLFPSQLNLDDSSQACLVILDLAKLTMLMVTIPRFVFFFFAHLWMGPWDVPIFRLL